MITNVIVGGTLLLGAMFVLARFVRPGLRDRIERPKHGFLERVEGYDRQTGSRKSREAGWR